MTKKIIQSLLLLLCVAALLLGGVACRKAPDEEVPQGMKYATASGSDYRLFVPSVWTSNTSYGVSGAYFTMSEPSTVSVAKYAITAEQATAMEGLEGSARLDWYWENVCLDAVERVSLGGSLQKQGEEPESVLLGALNARRYHVTATVSGDTLHFVHVLAERGGAVYVMTFTVIENLYASLTNNITSIIESFVFSDEPYYPDDYAKTPTEGVDAPDGMKLASNDTVSYRFFVPESWTLNREEEIFAAYVESDRSVVSVVPYMPDVEQVSVAEFFTMCSEMLENTADEDGFALLKEEKDVDLGGRKATAYTYRYTVGGKEFRCMQVIAAYGSMLYSVTYTATPESFEVHLNDVERIIDAFEFR